ncbi:MAG TPA: aspartate/glutamate racemase family protein [Beijerinckiaceae bacterium]|jgi:Asp/Glu/hydantoin racemase
MSDAPIIGVIHTSPATVDLFGRLLRERISGAKVINLLDDSILPELRENGADLAAVAPRWRSYARIVSERGVDVVLNACSSIGELCAVAQADIPQPIVRVDARMADEAVRRGERIGVAATLATTLRPTGDLIRDTAQRLGKSVAVETRLAAGAYEALIAGDQARHDALVAETLRDLAQRLDVVVLAQASMARVADTLDPALAAKMLASPAFAVEAVAAALEKP